MKINNFHSNSELETFQIAKDISKKIVPGDVFLIEGPLGAGKSVFIRGILSGLGVNEAVPSPTFTLVNEYKGIYPIYHFDLYRINNPFELYEIGFEDYVYSDGVSLIEWASKGGDLMPENAINIDIKIKSDNEREIKIQWNR